MSIFVTALLAIVAGIAAGYFIRDVRGKQIAGSAEARAEEILKKARAEEDRIARDLGEKLGTAGYLTQLRRTAIGPYGIDNATPLNEITPENWASLAKKLVP